MYVYILYIKDGFPCGNNPTVSECEYDKRRRFLYNTDTTKGKGILTKGKYRPTHVQSAAH